MFDLTLAITSVIATFYLNILCFLPRHLCRIRCMLDMFVLLYEPIILLAHLSASYHLPFLLDQINIVAESLCTIELPMNLREVSLVAVMFLASVSQFHFESALSTRRRL